MESIQPCNSNTQSVHGWRGKRHTYPITIYIYSHGAARRNKLPKVLSRSKRLLRSLQPPKWAIRRRVAFTLARYIISYYTMWSQCSNFIKINFNNFLIIVGISTQKLPMSVPPPYIFLTRFNNVLFLVEG